MSALGPYPQLWFTYGPKTSEDDSIRLLLEAGATGARLTFSHGTADLQVRRAQQVRRVAANRDVFIVADLQGEKCRLAGIEGVPTVPVYAGQPLVLTGGEIDLENVPIRLPLQVAALLRRFSPGDVIVEGDGALTLRATEVSSDGVVVLPLADGILRPGRGLTVQGGFVPQAITSKDLGDLAAIAESAAFDAVAVSFVSGRSDIERARDAVRHARRPLAVVAKIETAQALDRLDEIAQSSDALMAARGDLALAIPWEELPAATSRLAEAAARGARPWIVATQLMEGLERFAFPTRAEICDLAHWMAIGAYGAMLSFETAFGPRGVEAVRCSRVLIDRYKSRV